jgi:hypothetical protein
VRNLVSFLYILIKLTFFREILTLIKINRCLRLSGDIGYAYFYFFKILFSTFLVKKVFNSRFFRYIFF